LFLKNVYQYLASDLVDARTIKIIRSFFFGGILVLFSWFVYFSFSTIAIPYQIEYREGAAQVMTQILLRGGNPFSLEYQPLGMNNYGIGYNLLVLPFAKLFGNTLMVHRGISFFFLLASLLFVARIIFLLKKDSLISVLCGLFIVVVLAGRGGLGAFPSAMGTFLYLSGIFIPFIYSFRYPSLIASALLSIMAYYTKPYFVICFLVVAVYTFVFISKRKGVVYSLFFLCVFGFLFLWVRYGFELYFIDTFIGNLSNENRSLRHLRGQLVELLKEFFPSIILSISLLFLNGSKFSPGALFRTKILSRSKFLQLDAPLLNLPINYFAFAFIFCFLSFIFVLGLHGGSYMTSAYQIVLPPFILWLFQKLNSKSRFSIICFCLLFSNILILNNILLNPSFLRQRDSVAWKNLYSYVRDSRWVVNCPAVVSALIDIGIVPIDSGQTEYYYYIQSYPNHILFGPEYDAVKRHGILYRRSIRNAIRKGEFDKLILTEGYGNLISFDAVDQYYIKVETIAIDMPQTHQTWVIGVWEPISK
jgi:hypothetical protein